MRFYDEITIHVQSGKGGDGIVTGRKELGIPYGGPAGGNGGKWWSIYIRASKDENTLVAYRYRSIFKAKPGAPGRGKDQYGANADDITLTVPVGTLIRDKLTGEILHVFTKDEEEWMVVDGGEGGLGNIHFKDSVNQYPNFALLGEPWHSKDVVLELQLLADVALIGTPSVGKSSLINSISNTKAKVADYPFTTLVPNLGSVSYEEYSFNVIDIPGLIKGAADGKGLWNAFLRHILKSRVFCLILDLARYDTGFQEVTDLLDELTQYIQEKCDPESEEEIQIEIKKEGEMITLYARYDDRVILEKRILFALNKFDLVNDEEIVTEYKAQLKKVVLKYFKKFDTKKTITDKILDKNIFTVSAATHYELGARLGKLVNILQDTPATDVYHIENLPIQEEDTTQQQMLIDITETERPILIEQNFIEPGTYDYAKVWEVHNPEICKLVRQMRRGNQEAENRFWKTMNDLGYLQTFELAGINKGDILKIISYYAGKEDRYIVY